MCFHFGSLPDYCGGAIIAQLNPGDEVTVKKDFGYPPADEDTVEIIATVDKMSALTASGRALRCGDGYGVEATGQHFDEFELSPEAQIILGRVSLQKALEGKFRVVVGTPFDGNWKLVGDFDSFKKARAIADGLALARPTRRLYVYDDQGELLHESGTFKEESNRDPFKKSGSFLFQTPPRSWGKTYNITTATAVLIL